MNKFVDAEKLEAGKPDAAKVATLERGATCCENWPACWDCSANRSNRNATGSDDAIVGDVMKLIAEVRTASGDKYLTPGQENAAGDGNPLEGSCCC